MHIQPTDQHLEQLQNALQDAFDHAALNRLARYGLELDLEWITPVQGKRDLTTVIAELIDHFASQQGGLKRLLVAACKQNPTNELLAQLSTEWSAREFEPILQPQQNDIENTYVAISIAMDNGKVENSSIYIGDVTGGDKIIQGDEVHGDKFTGNKIVYEQIMPKAVDEATLAMANAKLKTLSLDSIPQIAVLPAGSRIPYSVNPLFVGREKELLTLAAHLKGGETIAIGQIAAVTGLGGIGKTQLVAAFVHHFGQFFAGGVHWLSFADPKSVPAEIAACGLMMSDLRADYATLDLETQVRLVLAAWQSPLPRLLVFDNCEDPGLLAQWKPPTGGSRVLLTSRRVSWEIALGVSVLALETLPRAQSIELLRKFRPELPASDTNLDQIAAELGDLPLALHLAGSFLARYRHSMQPAEYLAQLRQPALLNHRSLQLSDHSPQSDELNPTKHVQHVQRTFALSYEQLSSNDPVDKLAQVLLAHATCFAPGEPIARALLLKTMGRDDEVEKWQLEDGLQRLIDVGLLEEVTDEALRLHRLVAYFVKQGDSGSLLNVQTIVESKLLEIASRINLNGLLEPFLSWQMHLRYVTDKALQRADERAAKLCNELGYHLNAIGDLVGAKPYYEKALAINDALVGIAHPETARSYNNLGRLLRDTGDLTRSKFYYERAVTIREKVLGTAHPETARSYNNLGWLLQSSGDLVRAKYYLERALAIIEATLGTENSSTANCYNNLGLLMQTSGDLNIAKSYHEKAVAIRESVLGNMHRDTASSYNNLGWLLHESGDLAGAKFYYERSLVIKETLLGTEHSTTSVTYNNLGKLLLDCGDLAGAKHYLQRALQINESVFGIEHHETARSYNNLALLLLHTGDLARAKHYFQQALTIRESVLGTEHPDTARSYNKLGSLLQNMGEPTKAKSYIERALEICELSLGLTHPYTQTVRKNLDNL